MLTQCPVCDQLGLNQNNSTLECALCNSSFKNESEGKLQLIKSGFKFDRFNLIAGLIFIAGFMYIVVLTFTTEEINLEQTGLMFLVFPVAVILKKFTFVFNTISNSDQGLFGLYSAFFSRKIKYFDFGSKVLIYSAISIQLVGLTMLAISY